MTQSHSDRIEAASTDLKHRLRTSAQISRMVDQPLPSARFKGVAMADPATSAAAAAGGLLAKLLPAAIGAWLMVMVDPPQNKRELFTRLFVGLTMSFLLTGTTIDVLHGFGWLSMLDPHNLEHVVAVAGIWGAFGWFVIGGLAMWLKKFRGDPAQALHEVKDLKG